MTVQLDLADIQGNILTAYGKLSFPRGRVMLVHFNNSTEARAFVTDLLPKLTTALRWPSTKRPKRKVHMKRPAHTVNIGFTWYGLLALGVPTRTLRGMPDEFIDGMARRASMLGDNRNDKNKSAFAFIKSWDLVWQHAADSGTGDKRIHAFILLNAGLKPSSGSDPLDDATKGVLDLAEIHNVTLLTGHDPHDETVRFQELAALTDSRGNPGPKEHFGFTDAIGDPVFEGQFLSDQEKEAVFGNGALGRGGKLERNGTWRPLATGEFLLGYPDEAQEIAGAAMPLDFSRNGTFVAYRKLHQNVATFRTYMMRAARDLAAFLGIADVAQAHEILLAKVAGRWSDGVPLSRAPTPADWAAFNKDYPPVDPRSDPAGWLSRDHQLRTFTYGDDREGIKCPVTAHIRRINTRDDLAPTGMEGSILNNRRRILRRGLPYGESPPDTTDEANHGIVTLVTCASLFRQFEFTQQQWLNYGLDANAGNDTCPLVGNHTFDNKRVPPAKFVIPADPKSGLPPFILSGLPQFVETRGGDYFFVPSMTALRMIGMGVVDPT